MSSEQDLLRSLDDEPDTPSTVDIRRAISTARRRRLRRSAGYAGAAAVTAVAVTGASIATGVFGSDPSAPITQAATASAAPAWAPSSCTLERLAAPDKAPMAIIGGADPTGRYLVGRSYPKGGGYQAVLWQDGKPKKVALPGNVEEDLRAVNSSGTAVGFSYDSGGSVPYAYSNGEVTRLPGVQHGDAGAINDKGEILGSNADDKPIVWKSLTDAPATLPLPAGTKQAAASDLDEDGTIVGSIDYKRPYIWLPNGTHHELPMPVVDGKPVAVAQAHHISNGWVTGMASITDLGPKGLAKGAQDQLRAVTWNLRTGKVTATAALKRPADAVNAQGWQIGTDKEGHAALVTSKGTVTLPELAPATSPNGVSTIANAMSADGRLIAGQSDDKKDVIRPVVWHCE